VWTSAPAPCTARSFWCARCINGSDEQNLNLRVDFHSGSEQTTSEMEARLNITAGDPAQSSQVTCALRLWPRQYYGVEAGAAPGVSEPAAVEFAFKSVLEARLSLAALGARGSDPVRFQFSLWQGGLPMDAVPQQDWIEMPGVDQADWGV
jgi:hypothetical protein